MCRFAFGWLLLSCCLISGISAWFQPPDPQVFWFEQQLDHFNDSDTRTFKQRYLIYSNYYYNSTSKQKPVFFTPGGEANVFGGYQHNGFMFQYGAPLGAFMLFPEHRYYGLSIPFGPRNAYKPENIQYLTVEQALQDYIVIINFVMKNFSIPQNTPVISFGGSYPGELAAYIRVRNPEVIWGSLASSAPVRYHPFLPHGTHSGAFYSVVTRDFGIQSPECPKIVRNAFIEMKSLFSSQSGRETIAENLQLCSVPEAGEASHRDLNLWVENAFASLGMENYPYAIPPYPAYPMYAACNASLSVKGNVPDTVRLQKALSQYYNASGDLKCFNISREYLPCSDITGCGGGEHDPDAKSWDYQSCTEIVANVDTNNVTDMFPAAPYNFTRLVEYCQKVWGTTPDPLKVPLKYNYVNSTRIIFSNGFLDPWWPGGVLVQPNQDIITIQMPGAAHHLDLRGSDPSDPTDVIAARYSESQIINKWLDEYYKNN